MVSAVALRHAGRVRDVVRRLHRDGGVIVPAVEVAVDLDDLVLAGERPGQPHCHHRRLGAGTDELDPLGRWHNLMYELGPTDLQIVTGAVVRTSAKLLACGG